MAFHCAQRMTRGRVATIGTLCVLCLILLVPGCQVAEQPAGEGPAHRRQELALTPQQELQLGREAYREVLSHPDQYGPALTADDPEVLRVRSIMQRIVKAAGIEPLQREINLRVQGYRFEWEVSVLKNRQRNAFCLPAGKMAVFTGLLPVAETDDHLATVMSHEISHALAHHASERVARETGYEKAQKMVGGLLGSDDSRKIVGVLAGLRSKAYDREQEAEADHIGLFLMTFAGFDPREAVRFWARMGQVSGGRGVPEILSDHPSDEHRIQNMERWVPAAEAAKRAYDEGRFAPAPKP